MVHKDVADDVLQAFRVLYDGRFPIHRMDLIDEFGADDEASMQADNTSAFNCRRVSGSDTWSQHSYGTAIDINPLENPEVNNGQVDPTTAQKYTDRTLSEPGMIVSNDSVVRAFSNIGWTWGGTWSTPKDYMHFSQSGT
jgi:poly-gamma-glutamate synthesis protein (capsule biosynthesis protein)